MSFISDVDKFISDIPIVGTAFEIGKQAFEGSLERSVGSAQVRANQEQFNQSNFQTSQTVSTAAGLGFGGLTGLLTNPIVLLGIGVLLFIKFK